jgi:hypothetical protein
MSYKESKVALDKIRNDYGCQGEVLFRTALQSVIERGSCLLQDTLWVQTEISNINAKHDKAKKEGKVLFVARGFEIAIVECAAEIAKVPAMDLLQYVQKEIWLGGDGVDYQRAIQLLQKCVLQIEADEFFDCDEVRTVFQNIGFTDDEFEEFGIGYLLNNEEEE